MWVCAAVPEALKTSKALADSNVSSWLSLLATASAERVPPAAMLATNVPIVSTNHNATTGQRCAADQTATRTVHGSPLRGWVVMEIAQAAGGSPQTQAIVPETLGGAPAGGADLGSTCSAASNAAVPVVCLASDAIVVGWRGSKFAIVPPFARSVRWTSSFCDANGRNAS